MGQPKNGGYSQLPTMTPEQQTLLSKYTGQALPWQQQAAQGFQQFLPGGGGGQPIIDAAMKNYQQKTIPSITNAFGSNAKSSSALNQALASSASDLNTNLASQLAQMQMQASQGLGGLGQNAGNQALNAQSFAYQPTATPFWQDMLLSLISGGSQLGSAFLGMPK
jgi:hypothetical protein